MPVRLFRRRPPDPVRTLPPPDPNDVRRLEIRARKLMENRALGAYDSVFRGHGVEFAEVRAYQPGDPFQAIDWKVTARMGRPYVKKFVEERELSVLIAVDVSGSLGTGTRGRTKYELALEVAALLGLAATRNNDRVGLLLFSDGVERWIRPRRGRGRLRQLLHVLVTHEARGLGTNIGLALRTLVRALDTRSRWPAGSMTWWGYNSWTRRTNLCRVPGSWRSWILRVVDPERSIWVTAGCVRGSSSGPPSGRHG